MDLMWLNVHFSGGWRWTWSEGALWRAWFILSDTSCYLKLLKLWIIDHVAMFLVIFQNVCSEISVDAEVVHIQVWRSHTSENKWMIWTFTVHVRNHDCCGPRTVSGNLHLMTVYGLPVVRTIPILTVVACWYVGFQAFPNLLRLNLRKCTSIRTLPDSIGRLSKLHRLYLDFCENLQKLPSSIGQLKSLNSLHLGGCSSLECLPDTITALSRLEYLIMGECFSMSELPSTIGLMRGLKSVSTDLVAEWQAVSIGHLNALEKLAVTSCTNEAVSVLDRSGTLGYLDQLGMFVITGCDLMTKLPETIGLLSNLGRIELWDCGKVRELPNSIGELQKLRILRVRDCSSLGTLPESLGALRTLQELFILNCTSMRELPTSMGHLSSLHRLVIEGCGELQSLPDSLRQLDALQYLHIMECGSLEGLGARRVLQGLRIWGCLSLSELPGSCLVVVDSNFCNPSWCYVIDEGSIIIGQAGLEEVGVEEVGVVEADECGFLRVVQDTERRRVFLQRVYKFPCVKSRPSPASGDASDCSLHATIHREAAVDRCCGPGAGAVMGFFMIPVIVFFRSFSWLSLRCP